MTVEVRPLNVLCNIQCQYCYQNAQRNVGDVTRHYDLDKIKAAVLEEGKAFSLFGGEPLLMPIRDLEDLWSWGYRRFARNSVQTNGTLITEDHLRLFTSYNVHVGVSIDGPGELNDARWNGTLERTRAATAAAERAIELLLEHGIVPSLIVTLHACNASESRLPRLCAWLRELDAAGIRATRLHLLEVDDPAVGKKYALTDEQNLHALLTILALEPQLRNLRFDIFSDMRNMLLGCDDNAACVWKGCDPYTTRAVRGIEGDGRRTNCGRVNKEGIDFVKARQTGFERYLALYATPHDSGGCNGCRFFLMCKGQCPGTALAGDWRNRTEHCAVLLGLFARLEAEIESSGGEPLSLSEIRPQVEEEFLEAWANGENPSLSQIVAKARRRHALV
jgi:radical SAM protein with 4Fe4S-binding SPASM domain